MVASLKDGGESVCRSRSTRVWLRRPRSSAPHGGRRGAHTTAAHLTFHLASEQAVQLHREVPLLQLRQPHAPVFTVTSRVGNDGGTVNSTSRYDTEPFALKRNTLDADLYVTPKIVAVSVWATRSDETRNDRIFSTVVEHRPREVRSHRWRADQHPERLRALAASR